MNSRKRTRFSCIQGKDQAHFARTIRRGVVVRFLPSSSRKRTVLVVDDHAVVRELFAEFLQDEGYEVLQADGPRPAQELAARARIDLLLTDFRMPQMNGFELGRWFRLTSPETKVVIVSGAPWEVEPYFPEREGFQLLGKAEAFSRLAAIVRQLLGSPVFSGSYSTVATVNHR